MIVIQNEEVLLLHQSVRDYLVAPETDPNYSLNELEAHANVAYRCIDLFIEQSYPREKLHTEFWDYANKYWANHVCMAESQFYFETSSNQAGFFRIDSPYRNAWLQTWWAQEPATIPSRFSLLHVAAKWGIPAIISRHVCSLSSQNHEQRQPHHSIDVDRKNGYGQTPLEVAVQKGHLKVISELLRCGAETTTRVVRSAVENTDRGREVIAMLFEWRRDHISTIFEAAILAAFENWTSGKKVVDWMLTKPGNQISITESVVQAAAANKVSGMEIMFLLLKRRGDQIPITENVVRAAAANDMCGNVIMALLFNERRDRLPITADISRAAAVNGYEMMSFLLDR